MKCREIQALWGKSHRRSPKIIEHHMISHDFSLESPRTQASRVLCSEWHDAQEQAAAAHLEVALCRDPLEALPQALALALHRREELRLAHAVEDIVRGGADERRAREGAAVVARRHAVRHLGTEQHGADGQAARQGLGQPNTQR